MTHIAAVGVGSDIKNQRCFVVIVCKTSVLVNPSRAKVWRETLVPEVKARLKTKGMPIAGVLVWDRPMPLDPRHNSKIVYKQLAKNIEPVFADPESASPGFFFPVIE